jgi:CBS domain-containing protein
MALLTVADAQPRRGAVVPLGAPAEESRRVMAEHRVDWVGILDGDRILGWIGADEVDGEAAPKRFAAWVAQTTPLREALDTIVDSRTRVAIVLDGERYVGMVTIDDIAEGMAK